jgi:hypothetical protein
LIAILVLLAIATAPGPAGQACALSRLDACADTSRLFHDQTFARKIKAFVGKGDADYLYHGALAAQQLEVLGGPPSTPEKIGGLYLFTACRQHSCAEKGAVVMDPSGDIVATAILHSACAASRKMEDCQIHNTLAVFVKNTATSKPIVDDLSAWARSQVQSSYAPPGGPRHAFDGVEVFAVVDGARKRISPR